jgi:hypothetical protein
MHKNRLLSTLLLLVATALFVYGVIEILTMRFQTGDVYPPYSSYRSDPRGTRAFYEGLSRLPEVETLRNVEPLTGLSGLSEATLFLFGLERTRFSTMERATVQALEDAASGGGRIVISFVPTEDQPSPPSEEKEKKKTLQKDMKKQKDEERDEEHRLHGRGSVDLTRRLSVEIELSAEKGTEASLSAPERDLPPSLAWYGTLVFKPGEDAWRTLYARAGRPVAIERSYGRGSIVLSSDSFFLSNEALKKNRYPDLLSWLCGNHQTIIFDETHLGVFKSPGIATLLRKYGLAPFFISLIVLALLAIWRQAASLVPAFEEDQEAAVNTGKDYATGLTNLLRRNIASDDILIACLEEWKRSFTHGKQNLSALLPRIQEMIAQDHAQPGKNRNPVQTYRKISNLGTRR